LVFISKIGANKQTLCTYDMGRELQISQIRKYAKYIFKLILLRNL